MSDSSNADAVRRGLAGVVADTTSVSKVDPETNSLWYRGYPVQELAADRDVEDVAALLLDGELPDDAAADEFRAAERRQRALGPVVRRVVDELPRTAHPMDVVRTAVSVIGARGERRAADPASARAAGAELFAALPAVIAYDQRRRRGLDLIEPRDDLGYAASLLHQTFGEEPDDAAVDAMRVSMILYAEHSFNASTFTARVVASTLADPVSAVVAAIGALKGPLHGGANEAVLDVLTEIGDPDRVDAWLDETLAAKRKVMGFGHRVYRNGDSRVPTMRDALERLAAARGGSSTLLETARRLESAMLERTGIHPNLDFPSGPAYALLGFDTEQFTPLFVASRVLGWSAHIAEQYESGALIRPLSEYVGPGERHVG